MNFRIFGPYPIPTELGRSTVTIERDDLIAFWGLVENAQVGLSAACGCYVFGLRSRTTGRQAPWYIGMAEKQTFKKECFQHHKLTLYHQAMTQRGNRSSEPIMYFVAKCTPSRGSFAKVSAAGSAAIQFVERKFIELAVWKNEKLLNTKDTKLARELSVEGFYNSRRRGRPKPVSQLQELLGVSDGKQAS